MLVRPSLVRFFISTAMKTSFRLLVVALLATSAASCDRTSMTARELYDACSIGLHIPEVERTSEQKIEFARCKNFAQRVFYENGFVYVGEGKDPKIQELKSYCPAIWTAPIGGPYVYLVQYWDKHGMSYFERHFKGADAAALEVYRKMYPQCPEKRAAAGVPKVTEY